MESFTVFNRKVVETGLCKLNWFIFRYILYVQKNEDLEGMWIPSNLTIAKHGKISIKNNYIMCPEKAEKFFESLDRNIAEEEVSKRSNGKYAYCESNSLLEISILTLILGTVFDQSSFEGDSFKFIDLQAVLQLST